MKDSDGFVLFIFGCIVFGGLFFGIVYTVKKAFNAPPRQQAVDSSALINKQKRRAEDTEYQRKIMMEQLKQKNRDFQRRNKLK